MFDALNVSAPGHHQVPMVSVRFHVGMTLQRQHRGQQCFKYVGDVLCIRNGGSAHSGPTRRQERKRTRDTAEPRTPGDKVDRIFDTLPKASGILLGTGNWGFLFLQHSKLLNYST